MDRFPVRNARLPPLNSIASDGLFPNNTLPSPAVFKPQQQQQHPTRSRSSTPFALDIDNNGSDNNENNDPAPHKLPHHRRSSSTLAAAQLTSQIEENKRLKRLAALKEREENLRELNATTGGLSAVDSESLAQVSSALDSEGLTRVIKPGAPRNATPIVSGSSKTTLSLPPSSAPTHRTSIAGPSIDSSQSTQINPHSSNSSSMASAYSGTAAVIPGESERDRRLRLRALERANRKNSASAPPPIPASHQYPPTQSQVAPIPQQQHQQHQQQVNKTHHQNPPPTTTATPTAQITAPQHQVSHAQSARDEAWERKRRARLAALTSGGPPDQPRTPGVDRMAPQPTAVAAHAPPPASMANAQVPALRASPHRNAQEPQLVSHSRSVPSPRHHQSPVRQAPSQQHGSHLAPHANPLHPQFTPQPQRYPQQQQQQQHHHQTPTRSGLGSAHAHRNQGTFNFSSEPKQEDDMASVMAAQEERRRSLAQMELRESMRAQMALEASRAQSQAGLNRLRGRKSSEVAGKIGSRDSSTYSAPSAGRPRAASVRFEDDPVSSVDYNRPSPYLEYDSPPVRRRAHSVTPSAAPFDTTPDPVKARRPVTASRLGLSQADAAAERQRAYREELEQQMAEARARKQADKRRERLSDPGLTATYDPWGRPGAGAPTQARPHHVAPIDHSRFTPQQSQQQQQQPPQQSYSQPAHAGGYSQPPPPQQQHHQQPQHYQQPPPQQQQQRMAPQRQVDEPPHMHHAGHHHVHSREMAQLAQSDMSRNVEYNRRSVHPGEQAQLASSSPLRPSAGGYGANPAERAAKLTAAQQYRADLEAAIAEKKAREAAEKDKLKREDEKFLAQAADYNPFGRPGAGAPTGANPGVRGSTGRAASGPPPPAASTQQAMSRPQGTPAGTAAMNTPPPHHHHHSSLQATPNGHAPHGGTPGGAGYVRGRTDITGVSDPEMERKAALAQQQQEALAAQIAENKRRKEAERLAELEAERKDNERIERQNKIDEERAAAEAARKKKNHAAPPPAANPPAPAMTAGARRRARAVAFTVGGPMGDSDLPPPPSSPRQQSQPHPQQDQQQQQQHQPTAVAAGSSSPPSNMRRSPPSSMGRRRPSSRSAVSSNSMHDNQDSRPSSRHQHHHHSRHSPDSGPRVERVIERIVERPPPGPDVSTLELREQIRDSQLKLVDELNAKYESTQRSLEAQIKEMEAKTREAELKHQLELEKLRNSVAAATAAPRAQSAASERARVRQTFEEMTLHNNYPPVPEHHVPKSPLDSVDAAQQGILAAQQNALNNSNPMPSWATSAAARSHAADPTRSLMGESEFVYDYSTSSAGEDLSIGSRSTDASTFRDDFIPQLPRRDSGISNFHYQPGDLAGSMPPLDDSASVGGYVERAESRLRAHLNALGPSEAPPPDPHSYAARHQRQYGDDGSSPSSAEDLTRLMNFVNGNHHDPSELVAGQPSSASSQAALRRAAKRHYHPARAMSPFDTDPSSDNQSLTGQSRWM